MVVREKKAASSYVCASQALDEVVIHFIPFSDEVDIMIVDGIISGRALSAARYEYYRSSIKLRWRGGSSVQSFENLNIIFFSVSMSESVRNRARLKISTGFSI